MVWLLVGWMCDMREKSNREYGINILKSSEIGTMDETMALSCIVADSAVRCSLCFQKRWVSLDPGWYEQKAGTQVSRESLFRMLKLDDM